MQDKDGNCTADAGGKVTVYITESMHVHKLSYHPTCHYGYIQVKPVCSDTSNDDTELPAVPFVASVIASTSKEPSPIVLSDDSEAVVDNQVSIAIIHCLYCAFICVGTGKEH